MFIDGLGEITESINAGKSSSKSTGIIGEESISLQTETTDYTKNLNTREQIVRKLIAKNSSIPCKIRLQEMAC